MALKNIGDTTYANLWSNVIARLRENRVPRRPARARHDYSRSESDKTRPSKHFRRLMSYPDHHQLNAMDYTMYLSDSGIYPINWTATNQLHTKFELNPKDHGNGGDNLASVYITTGPHYERGTWNASEGKGKVAPYAQYHGHPLTNATFLRYGTSAGTNSGNYGYNDGIDPLGNYMLMIHNHRLAKSGQSSKELDPSAENKKTMRWLTKHRMKFILGYHKLYGTYQTHFPYTGSGVCNRRGVAHSRGRGRIVDDGRYHDIPAEYRDHPKKGHPRGWWNPSFSAYRYLNKVRGIPKDVIHYELATDKLRSYSGSIRYDVFKNVDPEELSHLKDETTKKVPVVFNEKAYKHGIDTAHPVANGHALASGIFIKTKNGLTRRNASGPKAKLLYFETGAKASDIRRGYKVVQKRYSPESRYDPKTKTYYAVKSDYHPMVEFVWKSPEKVSKALDPKRSSALIRKYGITQPKNEPKYIQSHGKDTLNLVVKGHPKARVATVVEHHGNKTVVKPQFAYVMKPTGRYKNVGSDRIYLNGDKNKAKRYAARKPHMVKGIGEATSVTEYMPTDGTVAKQMFSRGKQIAKHSQKNFGDVLQTGNGKDRLYLLEDPIDVRSLYVEHRDELSHTNSTMLSLGGVTKLSTINNVMKAYSIDPKDIYICFDNDPAGHRSMMKILAGDHNKIENDIHHKPALNGHRIHVIVTGGSYDSYHHVVGKALSGDLGEHHWKDCNDVLQCETNLGVYHNKVPYSTRLAIRRTPDTDLNPSQAARMVVNNGMMSAGPQNTRKVQRFFNDYYRFSEAIKHRSLTGQKRAGYMMRHDYRSMDSQGKDGLDRLMNTDEKHDEGAKFTSPEDLAICANHYPGAKVIRSIHIMPARVYNRRRSFQNGYNRKYNHRYSYHMRYRKYRNYKNLRYRRRYSYRKYYGTSRYSQRKPHRDYAKARPKNRHSELWYANERYRKYGRGYAESPRGNYAHKNGVAANTPNMNNLHHNAAIRTAQTKTKAHFNRQNSVDTIKKDVANAKRQGLASPKWQAFFHKQTKSINARSSARQRRYSGWRRQNQQHRYNMSNARTPKRTAYHSRRETPSWQR